MKEKKHGCGHMTVEEYLEIESNSYGGNGLTMEKIAAMGPEGRAAYRKSPSNPYFPKPDLSLFDESLYDGCKIRKK